MDIIFNWGFISFLLSIVALALAIGGVIALGSYLWQRFVQKDKKEGISFQKDFLSELDTEMLSDELTDFTARVKITAKQSGSNLSYQVALIPNSTRRT